MVDSLTCLKIPIKDDSIPPSLGIRGTRDAFLLFGLCFWEASSLGIDGIVSSGCAGYSGVVVDMLIVAVMSHV
ncbi:hypothetical protein Tco_1123054 [Tanacetum coccineum]|uniref:Uncharacterized protein n=1 Tax=Tanacetum coccineum TaxID=301880 RepID=A0ABQ5J298_9ASTR